MKWTLLRVFLFSAAFAAGAWQFPAVYYLTGTVGMGSHAHSVYQLIATRLNLWIARIVGCALLAVPWYDSSSLFFRAVTLMLGCCWLGLGIEMVHQDGPKIWTHKRVQE